MSTHIAARSSITMGATGGVATSGAASTSMMPASGASSHKP